MQSSFKSLWRYFFANSKQKPKTFIGRLISYSQKMIKATIGGTISAAAVLGAAQFAPFLASSVLALSTCVLACTFVVEIFCFSKSIANDCFEDLEKKFSELKRALKAFDDETKKHKEKVRELLMTLEPREAELTPKILHTIRENLNAMDFNVEAQKKKFDRLSDLAAHFLPLIDLYLSRLKSKNEKQAGLFKSALRKIVTSKIKGKERWSPATQGFLNSAEGFLEVQKILKNDFHINICYKEKARMRNGFG